MSTVLEVSPAEIKETVRRDRCDWVAAIYNLLHDQPEGQSILQRLITEDQEDELMDAAHHYQNSTEHIRLSQGGEMKCTQSSSTQSGDILSFTPSLRVLPKL